MSFKKTVIRLAIRFLIHVAKEIFLTEAEPKKHQWFAESDTEQTHIHQDHDR